jgi:FSR family fosmidomycin resistance protein-like MFS transporter
MFLAVSMTTYLPTFMKMEGASLKMAGISLTILEGAGVIGALLSGTISDRVGRKPTLLFVSIVPALLTIIFLQTQGWMLIPILIGMGFVSLSAGPVLLALVQDHVPNNRATGNGLYISMSFLIRSIVAPLVGLVGDTLGLRTAFLGSALVSFLTIPALLMLPKGGAETP